MLTHMSRGSETSEADFVTGSILAIIIVSDRVPAISSLSRLSMPNSRMLTRSVPCHSGRTFLTTDTMLLAICWAGLGCGAVAVLLVVLVVLIAGLAATGTF